MKKTRLLSAAPAHPSTRTRSSGGFSNNFLGKNQYSSSLKKVNDADCVAKESPPKEMHIHDWGQRNVQNRSQTNGIRVITFYTGTEPETRFYQNGEKVAILKSIILHHKERW